MAVVASIAGLHAWPPWFLHLIRFHGVLAPDASLRLGLVPALLQNATAPVDQLRGYASASVSMS